MAKLISMPSIEQYRHAIRHVVDSARYAGRTETGAPIFDTNRKLPTLTYRGTVKLHGTNAAMVMHSDGEIHFQSKGMVITPNDDNYGFARTMTAIGKDYLRDHIFLKITPPKNFLGLKYPIAVYGEWCGKGILDSAAIQQLDKMFVIFGIKMAANNDEEKIWLDMAEQKQVFAEEKRIYNIMNFPTYSIDIDFEYPQLSQNTLVEFTEEVEQECPVSKAFGVSGVGEGIVWACTHPDFNSSKFWFKVKGQKHSSSKTKKLAEVDVEKLESIREFVDYVLTNSRLRQGIQHLNESKLELSQRSTGDFLRWIFNDVVKEESDTLAEANLDKKDVSSALSTAARKWYFEYIKDVI